MNTKIATRLAWGAMLLALTVSCVVVWRMNPQAGRIFAVGAALFLVACAAVALLFQLWEKRQQNSSERALRNNMGSGNVQALKPSDKTLVNDLREKFDKGLGSFKQTGRGIYTVPWYLVMGESGAGKTEAIRHSGLPFPPNLNNFFQGVGGTVNMNWWFSAQCVLLDTAGRMVFESSQPGASNEWLEFLKLLRRGRRNCPINGVLLFIPVDTLICDSSDKIREKAGRLQYQLRVVQSQLGVRFPVYVVITKTDLLTGFREWVASWQRRERCDSIFGWSNPSSLDQDFSAEWVEELYRHLTPVFMRERSSGITRMVRAGAASGTQDDEALSALFALPNSLTLLKPRLKFYLDTIFSREAVEEGAPLPPFLRGIYFTSAMTEGAVLDVDLSEASGVPADEIQDTKPVSRDISYFLKELFTQKIFPEAGLVAPSRGSVQQRYLLRKATLVSIACLLLTLVGFSFYRFAGELDRGVSESVALWTAAKSGWTSSGYWNPCWVSTDGALGRMEYRGALVLPNFGSRLTVMQLHKRLYQDASRGITLPSYYVGNAQLGVSALNGNMRAAQVALVRRSVLQPLIDGARQRLAASSTPWSDQHMEAVCALLRMERMLAANEQAFDREKVRALLSPLCVFVSGKPLEAEVLDLLEQNFAGKTGSDAWLCAPMSGGASLASYPAIDAALTTLDAQLRSGFQQQAVAVEALVRCHEALDAFDAAEQRFCADVVRSAAGSPEMLAGYDELERCFLLAQKARSEYFSSMKSLGYDPGKFGANLNDGAALLTKLRKTELGNRFAAIESTLALPDNGSPLDRQIQGRLADIKSSLQGARVGMSMPSTEELVRMDQRCMRLNANADPSFSLRFDLYRMAGELIRTPIVQSDYALGGLNVALDKVGRVSQTLRQSLNRYQPDGNAQFKGVIVKLGESAVRMRTRDLVQFYARTKWPLVLERLHFPVTRGSNEELETAEILSLREQLRAANSDLLVLSRNPLYAKHRESLMAASGRIAELLAWIAFLVDETSGSPVRVTLKIPERIRQKAILEKAGVKNFEESFAAEGAVSLSISMGALYSKDLPYRELASREGAGDFVVVSAIAADQLRPTITLAYAPDKEQRKLKPRQIPAPEPWFFLRELNAPTPGVRVIMELDERRLYWVPSTEGRPPSYFAFELTLSRELPPLERWPRRELTVEFLSGVFAELER